MNKENVRLATVCYLIKDNTVSLPIKKKGVGAGFRNGYGGGIKSDESPDYAAIREILEEADVKVYTCDLNPMAILRCHNRSDDGQTFLYIIYAYWTKFWSGEPEETQEMGEPKWFPIDNLPIEELMLSDREWLQRFFRDMKPLVVTAHYGPNQLTLERAVEIEEVSELPEE